MYAIELLRSVSALDVVNKFTSPDWFFQEIDWDRRLCRAKKEEAKIKITHRYIEEYEKIVNYSYSDIKFDDSKIIFAGKRFGCDDEVFDVSLISLDRKDEILKSIKINGPEDILNFSNPCSSVDFSPRSEILGFKVSEKNIERYGKVVVAAAIFESLVSFCIDEDDRSERIEDITESLCKNIDAGETVDMETLREELGFEDNRSNIEKLREQYTNLFSSYVDVTDYILDIEEVLIEEGIIDDNFNKV